MDGGSGSVCAVRCLFVGRGESSSATHRCGSGSVGLVLIVSDNASVFGLAPSSVPWSCRLRCFFVGLGDGSRTTQRWGAGSTVVSAVGAAAATMIAATASGVCCC